MSQTSAAQLRNTRLRREYLYRKSLETKNQDVEDKKKRVRAMMNDGSASVSGMKNSEVKSLKNQIEQDDKLKLVLGIDAPVDIDDEYSNAGIQDPTILLTTSRTPSSRLLSFAKELKLILPNCTRANRGDNNVDRLMDIARTASYSDLVIVHETRGNPDSLIISHLPYGPTTYFALYNVVLRHDIKPKPSPMPLVYPHLIFSEFNSKLGIRISNVLKYLFPVPKPESIRVASFINNKDFISFRHYRYAIEGHKDCVIEEMGPRFEMRPFKIRLGTLDQTEADDEWALRNFTNSSKKSKVL